MEAYGDSVSTATVDPPAAFEGAREAPRPRVRARSYELPARLLLLFGDAAAIWTAFFLAYYVRYWLGLGGEVADENFVEYVDYYPVQLALVLLTVGFFHLRGLYNLARGTAWFDEMLSVAAGAFYGVGLLFAAVALVRYPANSRLTFIYAWVFIVVLVMLGRSIVRLIRLAARRQGLGLARVLVVGDNSAGRMIMQSIADQPHLGYQVVGFLALILGPDFGRFKRLGTLEELPKVCEQHAVDEVIIALPAAYHHEILAVRDHCQHGGL